MSRNAEDTLAVTRARATEALLEAVAGLDPYDQMVGWGMFDAMPEENPDSVNVALWEALGRLLRPDDVARELWAAMGRPVPPRAPEEALGQLERLWAAERVIEALERHPDRDLLNRLLAKLPDQPWFVALRLALDWLECGKWTVYQVQRANFLKAMGHLPEVPGAI